MEKILFVCLGNICRSPLAEGIMKKALLNEGLDGRIAVDSAGTGSWHLGEMPDERTYNIANQKEVELENPARQVTQNDLNRFDYIIAMDENNLDSLYEMDPDLNYIDKFYLMREFDPKAKEDKDVPDPYWSSEEEFEEIYNILERAVNGFLIHLKKQARESRFRT